MPTPQRWVFVAHLTISLLGAGAVFFAWLALFLVIGKTGSPLIQSVLWISAPLFTASGFAVGHVMGSSILGLPKYRPIALFVVLLVVCAAGAASVFWYGPMLIVFSMFVGGGICIVAWETHHWKRFLQVEDNK